MKYLLLATLISLASCDTAQKVACDYHDELSGLVAKEAEKQGGCDYELVKKDVQYQLGKVLKCPASGEFALSSEDLKCSLAPAVTKILVDAGSSKWKCSQAGIKVEELVKKAFKCDE